MATAVCPTIDARPPQNCRYGCEACRAEVLERAAIMEFEGRIPRAAAEASARARQIVLVGRGQKAGLFDQR